MSTTKTKTVNKTAKIAKTTKNAKTVKTENTENINIKEKVKEKVKDETVNTKHTNINNNTGVIIDDYEKIKNIDFSKYISLPWMTKYEFDQLIGLRTMHLSRGATPFIDIIDDYKTQGNMDLRQIVLKEIQEGHLPYIIKRPLPNGTVEYWPVNKLSLEAVKYMMR